MERIRPLVPLLERLALLRINEDALGRVVRCVEFADKIHEIDPKILENVEPMISPNEQNIRMRSDDRIEEYSLEKTLKNASKTFEDYFVAPSKHKHYSDL